MNLPEMDLQQQHYEHHDRMSDFLGKTVAEAKRKWNMSAADQSEFIKLNEKQQHYIMNEMEKQRGTLYPYENAYNIVVGNEPRTGNGKKLKGGVVLPYPDAENEQKTGNGKKCDKLKGGVVLSWLQFVKEYRNNKPTISYTEALKKCAPLYAKYKNNQ